jgi:putative ABC transport system permease protein
MRPTMLWFLYCRRLRAHPVQELLAGAGVAVGVALVFGVLLANSSLTSSATQLVHGLAGSARFSVQARSSAGFPERQLLEVRQLPGVQVATPVLRENVSIVGPRGRQSIQLIGVSPTLASLGGVAQQQLGNGAVLLSGGLGLPTGVASRIGVARRGAVTVIGTGIAHPERVGVVLGNEALKAIAGSPVGVTLLSVAQRLTGRAGRVTHILVEPREGQDARVAAELRGFAHGRLDVVPADDELRLLDEATRPNRQSTMLFSAISVMVGFLLALNAMLLTVPERRRFIAELRMQGYDPRQVLLLLGFQAVVLGLVASLVGVALGDVLARTVFHQVPAYLTFAFPIGGQQGLRLGTVLLAVGCGVLATVLASLSPTLDLRAGRPADAVFRESGSAGEQIAQRSALVAAAAGLVSIVLIGVLVTIAPSLTIFGGVALALATLALIPTVLVGTGRVLPRLIEGSSSGVVIVAASELRSITTRSVALAAIAGLAVYGNVAIGGARDDLLRGIETATVQYHDTADLWVTTGNNVFNTDSFAAEGPSRQISSAPGVRAVWPYQGGLLDIGRRRLWVRARSVHDPAMLEPSQLLHGSFERASALLRRGGWSVVSSRFADEHRLRVGSSFDLPTPSGVVRPKVAGIATNSGWPAGTITLGGPDYSRWWRTSEVTALEVDLRPGVTPAAGARAVRAALGRGSGLAVQTSAASVRAANASARQGLRTLGQISALLLIAAALAVAAALSAAVWQRRARLASLKIQGYHPRQLWGGLLLESGVMLGVGSCMGALVGIYGHALAGDWLTITTGFPAPFSIGVARVFLTLALITSIALAVIALPGVLATRVSVRVSLQE